jgi:serine/threonine protein phosphatase PrpC
MKYSLYQESRKGGRQSNQDRVGYSYTPETILMVLADGMGGHAKGDVAAQLLVDVVLSFFKKLAKPSLDDITEFLLDGIYTAHETINAYAAEHKMKDTPRTTCVVCVIQSGRAYWAHVGDSRLYHFSRNDLVFRTRDHSAVQHLLDDGLITEGEVNSHPDRNKLLNSVGGFMLPNIELSAGVKLREGDILLLSSDGFWSELDPDEMLATLRVYALKQSLIQLLDHAEYRAGERGDNLSVIALRCGDDMHEVDTKALNGLGLEGFTTELRELDGKRMANHPTMSDLDIDKAIEEIRTTLLKHNLDPKRN